MARRLISETRVNLVRPLEIEKRQTSWTCSWFCVSNELVKAKVWGPCSVSVRWLKSSDCGETEKESLTFEVSCTMSWNPKGRNLLTLRGGSQKTAGVNNLTTIFRVEKKASTTSSQPSKQMWACHQSFLSKDAYYFQYTGFIPFAWWEKRKKFTHETRKVQNANEQMKSPPPGSERLV